MRSGSAGSKYCERGACQKWQASFALMTIGKMRSRGVCKINPLIIKGGTVMWSRDSIFYMKIMQS